MSLKEDESTTPRALNCVSPIEAFTWQVEELSVARSQVQQRIPHLATNCAWWKLVGFSEFERVYNDGETDL